MKNFLKVLVLVALFGAAFFVQTNLAQAAVDLTVNLDASTPVSGTVNYGQQGVNFTAFKVTTLGQSIALNQISVKGNSTYSYRWAGSDTSIKNIQICALVAGGRECYWTIPQLTADNSDLHAASGQVGSFGGGGPVIPAYSSQTFYIYGDVGSAAAGVFSLGLSSIGYTSQDLSGAYTVTGIKSADITGNGQTINAATAGVIRIFSPNGGEQLQLSSTYRITWTDSTPSSNDRYTLFLTSANGSSLGVIANEVYNQLSYDWTVGSVSQQSGTITPGSQYYIQVVKQYTGNGGTDQTDAAFSIIAQALSITTASPLPSAKVGTFYSSNIVATGGTSDNWTISSGSLPPGLSICASIGYCQQPDGTSAISGTPTTAGTYTFTVQVTSGSQSASKQFSLTVDPITASVLPDFTITDGAISPKLANATNGIEINKEALVKFTIKNQGSAGQMPKFEIKHIAGLSPATTNTNIAENTCNALTQFGAGQTCVYAIKVVYNQLSTTTNYGSVQLTVSPTNAITESDYTNNWMVLNFDVRATNSVPTITSLDPSSGTVGATITINGTDLGLIGQSTVVKFGTTVAQFGLGTGINIQSVVVPNLSLGTYPVTVQIGQYVTNPLNFTVTSTSALSITATSPLPNAKIGTFYTAVLNATGGTPSSYNWKISDGSMPPGLSVCATSGLCQQATGTSAIYGTPTTTGIYTFTVTVSSDGSSPISKQFSLTVDLVGKPSITVVSPNGEENWASGSSQSITWTMPSDKIYHIELYLMPQGPIVKSTPPNPGTSDVMIDPTIGGYNIGGQTLSYVSSQGNYTWSISSLYPAGTYKIRAYLLIKDATYFDSSKVLAQDESDASFSLEDSTIINTKPFGWLDSISKDGYISGWALDQDHLGTSINVHIYFDSIAGKPITQVTDVERDDVNLIMSATGPHGFNVAIPGNLRDGKKHAVYIYAVDVDDASGASDQKLYGSPKIFSIKSTNVVRHPRGTVVIGEGATVYFLGTDLRYAFPSPDVFFSWGHKFSDLVLANAADLAILIGPVAELNPSPAQ